MNKVIALLAVLLSSGAAYAQSPATIGSAPAASVTIEPQYRTKIKSYVTENRIAPVTTREKIVVGATVPQEVELRSVPADWGPNLTAYRYVYSDNNVMLVDPATRRVIQIVD